MAKKIGGKAAKIALAAAGAAALSAVGTGVVQFCKWAKDPYSTELWFGFLKKGILITKTDEPHHFRVQTGYRWHDDADADEMEYPEEPEMEIRLPEDADLTSAEAAAEPETGAGAAAEAVSEAIEKAAETVEEAVEAAADTLAAPEAEAETPEADSEA